MSAYDWLGRWERIPAPGKHSRMVPADGAYGYPAPYHGQVMRAIQATGTVTDRPSWENSPQVRYWLEPEKESLGKRLRRWLMNGYGNDAVSR